MMASRSIDAKRALALLNAVGKEPSPTAVGAFDEFFYPLIVTYVRRRHRTIGVEMAAKTGARSSPAPMLNGHQIEEAAHVTALIGLRRARASASRFDPELGSAIAWVLRAAGFAYLEVAKTLARQQAELMTEAEAAGAGEIPQETSASDPAEAVAQQALVDDLFLVLSDDERAAAILKFRYDYTYAEVAEVLFGDASATKRVDHVLQSARRKLAQRWAALHPESDR